MVITINVSGYDGSTCINSKITISFLMNSPQCEFSLQRNPNIKLYGLPWGFPGWIGQGSRDPYLNPTITADYVIRWINGAKVHYNLTIDFVGVSYTE